MEIRVLIGIILAGVFVFLLLSSLIIQFFATTYEYGFGTAPCQKDTDGCVSGKTNLLNSYCISSGAQTPAGAVLCANCNTTTGYSTFLSSCYSLVSAINGTHCYSCANFGYKQSSIGLMLFTFFIIVVTLIIAIIGTIKKR